MLGYLLCTLLLVPLPLCFWDRFSVHIGSNCDPPASASTVPSLQGVPPYLTCIPFENLDHIFDITCALPWHRTLLHLAYIVSTTLVNLYLVLFLSSTSIDTEVGKSRLYGDGDSYVNLCLAFVSSWWTNYQIKGLFVFTVRRLSLEVYFSPPSSSPTRRFRCWKLIRCFSSFGMIGWKLKH